MDEQICISTVDAFDAVTTYAVDSAKTSGTSDIHKRLNLSMRTFRKHFYVQRKPLEEEILKLLVQSPLLLRVVGNPGCGKTSLVRCVLDELYDRLAGLVFIVDFKEIEELHGKKFQQEDAIADWLENHLQEELELYAKKRGIHPVELALLVLGEPHNARHLTGDAKFGRDELYRRYMADSWNRTSELDLPKWAHHKYFEERNEFVVEHLHLVERGLRASDKLYCLTHIQSLPDPGKAIIFLDNVDSIRDPAIRDKLKLYLRQYQIRVSDSTRLILSLRIGHEAGTEPADSRAYQFKLVEMDKWEWFSERREEAEVRACVKRKGFCTILDRKSIESTLYDQARARFDSDIRIRRVDYLQLCLKEERLPNNARKELDDLSNWHEAIARHDHIAQLLAALPNGDRRLMSGYVNSFIKYMRNTLGFQLEDLGTRTRDRDFNLESYFYGWLIDEAKVYDVSIYNVIKGVDLFADGTTPTNCVRRHLVLCAIYNLTHITRYTRSLGARTTVQRVLTRCKRIGLVEEGVQRAIFRLCKDGDGRDLGMLEITRFHSIDSASMILPTDQVCLTPRARCLLEYVTHKFAFLIGMMRHMRFEALGRRFDYDDKNSLTIESMNGLLELFGRLAKLSLESLEEIRTKMANQKQEMNDWLGAYRRWFCVDLRSGMRFDDGRGNTFVENMLGSVIKFLNRYEAEQDREHKSVVTENIIDL